MSPKIDLTAAITKNKEYAALCDCVKLQCTPGAVRQKRPLVAAGLCEGAEFAFLNNFINVAQDCSYNGILLVVPDEKQASRLQILLEEYGKRSYFYTARDLTFYGASASHEFEYERLFVLSALLDGKCDFVIATPEALLQYTVPIARLQAGITTVMPGDSRTPEQLVSVLENAGYHRVEIVESAGQYALRGGILDIFSPCHPNPARIDFFGDEIDRMCFFDVMTQRQIEDCPALRIIPARELIADGEAVKRVCSCISSLLKKCPEDAAESLKDELQRLKDGRETAFLDKYISIVYPEKECLLDYASDMLPVVIEYGNCMNRLEGQRDLLKEEIKSMLEKGTVNGRYADYGRSPSEFEAYLFEGLSVLLSNIGTRLSGHKYAGTYAFRTKQTTGWGDRFDLLLDDLRGYMAAGARVKLVCENENSMQNMLKMLTDAGFGAYVDDEKIGQRPATVALTFGQSIPGFELLGEQYVCLTELSSGTVINRARKSRRRKKDGNLQKILSYADLEVGDFVVHEIHGIGQYLGISSLTVEGVRRDFVKIKYDGKDMLYLPCGQLDRISKYIGKGAEEGSLKLSKMGGSEWKKAKYKAHIAAKDMAKNLISLYAARMQKEGIAFPRDDEMQREFESTFEYEETDCQLRAAEEIKGDMEKRHPMDRLLCGDVGYGKTEVALRAAFKAVEGGYQVAILVPTTILCMQHYRTLLSRMRGYPVSVDMVCRFRTKKEIDESLRKLRRGETDVIVGTHRLLSSDVEFKKLGLLIVDEEQRFGVSHKEKLKELSKNVDVLTLSATPIPRTLNMALSGIRDMSILDEAPIDRQPVQTFVLEYDAQVITEAIRRELRRGGQVFYLINNIERMPDVAAKIAKALPDVRIETANGQMDRELLSDIWEDMVTGKIDVLVSTTIIETGVDVPNANTLIIENADKMGLSQLHQLRGRVGRSARRAYAYFTYPAGRELGEIPQKRLEAIRDFTEFGSGFRIAMRDMEIRGVGNLLGAEQHGHMESIGYDLYMKLLSEAVCEEKGETPEKKTECTVELGVDAYIPESYIYSPNQRIDAYKKISLMENAEDYSDVCDELIDRYGTLPDAVLNLLKVSLVRAQGSKNKMTKIVFNGKNVLFYPETFDAQKMARAASLYNGALMISLGSSPYATLRTGSSIPAKMIKECLVFLEKYGKIEENA